MRVPPGMGGMISACEAFGRAMYGTTNPTEDTMEDSRSNPQGDPGGVGALNLGVDEPEIPDFAKPEDYSSLGGKAYVTIGEIVDTVVEMAASRLAEPPPLDDTGAGAEDIEDEPRHFSARELAEHLEAAPSNIELPDAFLPPGTDIHVELKGTFVFKLPGQPAAIGRGRTIYGAMVDAGILR